jgi:hypothetical protein
MRRSMQLDGQDEHAIGSWVLDSFCPTLEYMTQPTFSPVWMHQDIASYPLVSPVCISGI